MVPPPAPPGAALGPARETHGHARPAQPFALQRRLLAIAVGAMGAVDVASAVLSHPSDRLLALRHLVPSLVRDSSRTFTLLAGCLLLVTAWGLRRGKRRAFIAALFLCAVSVPVNLLKSMDFEEATVASGLLFALGASAQAFRVQSRELSFALWRSRALWAVLALFAYAVAGTWLLERHLGVRLPLGGVWQMALVEMFGAAAPHSSPLPPGHAWIARWYLGSLPILSVTLSVSLALASLRPARHRQRHRRDTRLVEQLLREHGESSLSWFAIGDDVDYFWSADRRAVIAYRFESDVVLAVGDPIGPFDALRPLLQQFAEFCWLHDWSFAFYQARPELLPLYASLGWHALHVGEDPVLWTDRFTLAGGRMGNVRRAVRHARDAGLQVLHVIPDAPFEPSAGLPPWLWNELQAISDEWLESRPGGEMSFCMGRFSPSRLRRTWLAVAWDPQVRRVEGFVSWVPVPARRGWALDLMRRSRDAFPGVMELLVVDSLERARERGDAMLSLSLSALARVPAEPEGEEAPIQRAREFVHHRLAHFYDFEGVYRWKRRFDPAFEDRYLVHAGPALWQILLALIRVQRPGGLLTWLGPWRGGRRKDGPHFTGTSTGVHGPVIPAPIKRQMVAFPHESALSSNAVADDDLRGPRTAD